MLDVAIIGGGLCGLALAHSLHARRVDFQLFEARDRLGGRVKGADGPDGTRADLGATWFWPETQPAMARLVADLALPTLAQPDDGQVLVLSDPNQPPQPQTVMNDFLPHVDGDAEGRPIAPAGRLHGGARRLEGGMSALIESFSTPLPRERLHLQTVLTEVHDQGDHVRLVFRPDRSGLQNPLASEGSGPGDAEPVWTVLARRVVLALPPRLVAQGVAFDPPLPPPVAEALAEVPTWMATAAKAVLFTTRPVWREAGLTGNAWSTHVQSVLAEVFDASACPTDPEGGALAGFFALDSGQRRTFERAMPLLLDSQVMSLFGPCPPAQPWVWQDWSREAYTCSSADLAEEKSPPRHPEPSPLLLAPHWAGKLHFGGSETGRRAPGYLEGALSAAGRLRSALSSVAVPTHDPGQADDAAMAAVRQFSAHFAELSEAVRTQRGLLLSRYQAELHRMLSSQDAEDLTQKALVGVLEAFYGEVLSRVAALPVLEAHRLTDERGQAALTPQVLGLFSGLSEALMTEVLQHNNTSCALSNFPDEHRPPRDYLQVLRQDLVALWRTFALAVNRTLLSAARVTMADVRQELAP